MVFHASLSMSRLTLIKTAKHSILSINLAIIHKYILGKVFQFDITEWHLAKCCTIWLYKQHSYSPSFFKIQKAKHLTYFLCLSKRNFPELRKRRNSVDCRQPHWSLYLQTSYGCERTTDFPLTWLPTQLSIFKSHSQKRERVKWNEFWTKNQSYKFKSWTSCYEISNKSHLLGLGSKILIQMEN